MQALGILALASVGIAGVLVGGRALLLSTRTGRVPELAMGLGLLLPSVVGMPFAAVGRMPVLHGTSLGFASLAIGLVATAVGVASLYVFTWKVFRPEARWARVLVDAAAAALGMAVVGLLHASRGGGDLADVLPRTRPFACAIVGLLGLSFAWTAFESLRYHGMQRRRLALGLADPVVTNRFLLWGLSGLATAALSAALVGFLLAGRVVLREPLPLWTIAATGVTTSVSWLLAFLPPRAYVRRLERRQSSRRTKSATASPISSGESSWTK